METYASRPSPLRWRTSLLGQYGGKAIICPCRGKLASVAASRPLTKSLITHTRTRHGFHNSRVSFGVARDESLKH